MAGETSRFAGSYKTRNRRREEQAKRWTDVETVRHKREREKMNERGGRFKEEHGLEENIG